MRRRIGGDGRCERLSAVGSALRFCDLQMTGFSGFIDCPESVTGMLKAVEQTDATTEFRWVDYKGDIVPG